MKLPSLLFTGTLLVFVCLVTAVFSSCQNRSALAVGSAAPDFTLEDSNGASAKLSGYKGKVVLLDFWATWCTGCKVEIPWYMKFAKKYEHSGTRLQAPRDFINSTSTGGAPASVAAVTNFARVPSDAAGARCLLRLPRRQYPRLDVRRTHGARHTNTEIQEFT